MFELIRWMIHQRWVRRLVGPLFGKSNPLSEQRLSDPYPVFRELRVSDPVFRSPILRIWLLTRYADCVHVLGDPDFSSNRLQSSVYRFIQPRRFVSSELLDTLSETLLMLDPPKHTRIRSLVNRAFTPRVVGELRPRIENVVEELLDDAAAQGGMDLVEGLAAPLPIIVIAEMLGIPPADRDKFKRWSNDVAALLDVLSSDIPLRQIQHSFDEMADYLRHVFAERRADPKGDLISALVSVEHEGEKLGDDELLPIAILLLMAGHETTTNLIGNAGVLLLRHPGERKRLQAEPGLIRSAIEEVLRYESPVQGTDRVALRDVEIGGKRIRKSETLILVTAAANRDPEQFPDPERFDVGRSDNRHLAFGRGIHFCLGANLARAEAQIAIGSLLRSFPDFSGPQHPEGWRPSLYLRGPTALRIRF